MAEGWNLNNQSRRSHKNRSDNNSQNSNIMEPKSNVCKFYLQGKCFFGINCYFLHQQPCSSNSDDETIANCDQKKLQSSTSSNICEKTFSGNTIAEKPSKISNNKFNHLKSQENGHKVRSKLADSINAPEFVPRSASKSYASVVRPCSSDDSNVTILCPYSLINECRYGDQCVYVHGEICELCGKPCLHPHDATQRKQHKDDCIKEHERDMEISFAVQRSQDKCCGICMDTVMEKESANERRFGILENCNHVFCLSCIRKWRSAKQFEHKTVRACPECRVSSDFVTPSAYWVEDEEDKKKLIENYKKALSAKHCKYFNRGRGECPFAGNCFYLHEYIDGTKAKLPPPQGRRRRQCQHGTFEFEFQEDWFPELDEDLFTNLVEMFDLVIDSDDDSDFSDNDYITWP